jgi:RPA family protein
MLQVKHREIAKRTWVCNLMKGSYTKSQGWTPGFVEYNGEKYARVAIVGSVVSKFVSEDGNYASVTIDDGTETIRLKAFGPDVAKLKDAPVGALVKCFGKVRQYAEELYLMPEIVHTMTNPNWLIVHKLQLGHPSGAVKPEESKPQVSEQAAVEVLKSDATAMQSTVLSLIKELDSGLGAEMDAVISGSGLSEEEAKNILFSLLKAGDVYEPKKGKFKVLA